MTVDHYEVLGLEPGAKAEEIEAAFEQQVAVRREKRQRTADVYAAYAVLSEPALKAMYDMTRLGRATNEKLVVAKEVVAEAMPDVDWGEVRQQTWQTTPKVTVLVSGLAAKAADATGRFSRRVQAGAAKRIDRPAHAIEPALEDEAAGR